MSIAQELINSLQDAIEIEQHNSIEDYIRARFEKAGLEESSIAELVSAVGALYFSGVITNLDQLCDSICALLNNKVEKVIMSEFEKERKYLGKWNLCEKCTYEITCDKTSPENCQDFHRDAPDGGYYG